MRLNFLLGLGFALDFELVEPAAAPTLKETTGGEFRVFRASIRLL